MAIYTLAKTQLALQNLNLVSAEILCNTVGAISPKLSSNNQTPTMSSNPVVSSSEETVDLDNLDCIDLSTKEFFLVVYFPESDPGFEYEIVSEKRLTQTWAVLQKGVPVIVNYGSAKAHGIAVAIASNLEYLEVNLKMITELHQSEIKRTEEQEYARCCQESVEEIILEDSITVKLEHKQTQTDTTIEATNAEYLDLKNKYDKLKNDYDKYISLFSDVKQNLEETVSKLQVMNISGESSSLLSGAKKEVLKPIENMTGNAESFNRMVQIGPGGTRILKTVYDTVNWTSYTAATRKLLVTLFSRKVLATHSLTGKPSPAFLTSDKQKKKRLDATIIADIVQLVSRVCKVSDSMVRNVITTKCADENKMYKKRMERNRQSDDENEDDWIEKPSP